MDHEAISSILISAINRVQGVSGHPLIAIEMKTCPIKDLPDFDSLLGIEATLELEEHLGPLGFENVFVNSTGTRAHTIAEIVELIKKQLSVRSLR